MRRDYRLYELNDEEFEGLVVEICTEWLGQGVTPFATGPDGGRDGKFNGTAAVFPSAAAPLVGHCVLQAKHVAAPNKSCSDREFARLLKKEDPKIKNLVKAGLCDHYMCFTNRKLTAGADQKLIADILKLGVKSAHIVGNERLHLALDQYGPIRGRLPNRDDSTPFRFDADDIVEVIGALHSFAVSRRTSAFDSARDFQAIRIKDAKNRINGLTQEYYEQIIVNGSMVYFGRVEEFLKNPRNRDFAALYHDSADELKQNILVHRKKFRTFDEVFAFLYREIQSKKPSLKYKRRLISILLHYMYFHCDIGSKELSVETAANADADP